MISMIKDIGQQEKSLLRLLFATAVAPPIFALTFRQTLEMYCGDAEKTCLDWRICDGTPKRMSQLFLIRRYTSTLRSRTTNIMKEGICP